MAIFTRLRTEENGFIVETFDDGAPSVVINELVSEPSVWVWFQFPLQSVAADDFITFHRQTTNNQRPDLPTITKEVRFLRTNLVNGDDADSVFVDRSALNTYLKSVLGNFSLAAGGGLAEGDAIKVDAAENLVYGDATINPATLAWLFDQTPSVDNIGLVSVNPSDKVEILDVSYLDLNIPGVVSTALVLGVLESIVTGVLTLDWKALTAVTAANHRWIMAGGVVHITANDRADTGFAYLGTLPYISGDGEFRILGSMQLVSIAGADLIDLDSGELTMSFTRVAGWNLGTVRNSVFILDKVGFFNILSGFILENCGAINVIVLGVQGTPIPGGFFTVSSTGAFSSWEFVTAQFLAVDYVFDFNTAISEDTLISITSTNVISGDLFRQTTTANINIDSVADDSPATGVITEMEDNLAGGTTISCATTYFNGETVTITGTTSYNQTVKAFNVVAGVSFDVAILFNGDDAAGSVDSFRLELTSPVAHGVSAGGNIKAINSTFYNGFYTALAVPGDTIIINADINDAGADSFEVQNNVGLDQEDARVLSTSNSGFINSNSIAFAHIEDNTALTTIVAADTYQDINITGSTGDIDSIDDNGGGLAEITTLAAHGLIINQNVKHRDTAGLYNGEFRIIEITGANTYVIDEPYTVFARGEWDAKLQPGCNMEGFKIVNQNICDLEYIKKEPFRGTVEVIIAADKQGNAEPYIWNIAVNNQILNGSPKVPTTITSNTSSPPSLNFPVDLVQGDRIKPQVAGVGTDNNLTHRIVSLSTK